MFQNIKKVFKKGRVFMVRHGSTDFNSEDISQDKIRGWIDIPLNDQGKQEAANTRDELEKMVKHVDMMYSSDLTRAQQTANIINKDYRAPIVSSNALRPWNLGIYQGKVTKDVIDDLNKMVEHETVVPPSGESFKSFKERYLHLLNTIIQKAKKEKETIIVVTHLRNVKLACSWIEAGMPQDYHIDVQKMLTGKFKPASIYEVPIK